MVSEPMGEVQDARSEAIGIEEIMRLLPHRYPFLLVDRAERIVPNRSIRGIKAVSYNESFFQGHFPNRPVMPGVLIIEALAQTGAVLMSRSMDIDVRQHAVFLLSVDQVRFRHPVVPGDLLEMDVEVLFVRRGIFKFRGQAQVRGQLAVEAEFAAKLVEGTVV
jgi:3-hydroxyacyl-[acyl-carrier-protein] dehydratase